MSVEQYTDSNIMHTALLSFSALIVFDSDLIRNVSLQKTLFFCKDF